MRLEKAMALLELARALAGSAEGMTLDEMAQLAGVDRRTAERMRDRLMDMFPQMEAVPDPPTKRFRIPAGLDGFMQAPSTHELAALGSAAQELETQGSAVRAAALRGLEAKVLSALRAPVRRRMAPDLEALLQAEAIAVQAGPRPFEDEAVLGAIREALTAGRALGFRYAGGSSPGRAREVIPYGLLFGRSNYLVAAEGEGARPRNWRLDRIEDVEVLARPALRPVEFSLQAYADQSFGIYQDDTEDVMLRISARASDSVKRWRFHVGQVVEPQPDGSVTVAFRASGMRELAWHLFTWGADVEVLAPERLRRLLVDQLRQALAMHAETAAE
ncbi:YafY family protein [Caulobacter sp. S45]|jgi:predicted DNA-binding transcriptional regulator YafY|uniref:helix-turn-helix transcriptional regulator n=1 Tax=Caulobacter sp. S45 TaxID=1641861 RepID=UPI00131B5DE9|nr:WYL domain-containing protein [Caulobacter sp. S45]